MELLFISLPLSTVSFTNFFVYFFFFLTYFLSSAFLYLFFFFNSSSFFHFSFFLFFFFSFSLYFLSYIFLYFCLFVSPGDISWSKRYIMQAWGRGNVFKFSSSVGVLKSSPLKKIDFFLLKDSVYTKYQRVRVPTRVLISKRRRDTTCKSTI